MSTPAAKIHYPTVCLVSPFPPPFGGMAIQAEKLAALLREQGGQVFAVRTNSIPGRGGALLRLPGVRSLCNLARFLRELDRALQRSEVVYFLTGFFNFYFWVTFPALLLIFYRRKPVILSARGGHAAEFFRRYGALVGPMLRRVNLITTPSGFLKEVFREAFGLEPVVLPNIADLEQFIFRRREEIRPRLLVTRNLEEIYGIDTILRAFALVSNHHPAARLGIAGDGSLRTDLEKLARDLGIEHGVRFYGAVNHEQIQQLYAEYYIYVNASRVDNLPGSLLEAFACGLPVVSTRAGGIPYMIEDGVTGLLVDLDDDQGLAARVLDLLESPDLAQRLIANGRKECEKYSAERVCEMLLPLLTKAVSP